MMDSMIMGINGLDALSIGSTGKPMKANKIDDFKLYSPEGKTGSFDSLLQSAIQMISETNRYSNEASEAEMAYAMGLTNNTHDLQVAQMKANISLQYTVAVRNAVMDAYREIMQMQF